MRRQAKRKPRFGFTLIELLVAMAIIAIIGGITVVAVRRLSDGARLSSATNTVTAALSTARSLAMAENKMVMVVFRPRLDADEEQFIELVFCEWTGETFNDVYPNPDRFRPIPDQPSFRLPKGVKVAFPLYGADQDALWVTQLEIDSGEFIEYSQMSGIMYGADGSVRTRNQFSDSSAPWVDFNNDLLMRLDGVDIDPWSLTGSDVPDVYFQRQEFDETFVSIAPFLAIYDDREARDRRATRWTNDAQMQAELVGPNGYIANNADRIHFNRYTGVPMR